jgi:hypothetical protein
MNSRIFADKKSKMSTNATGIKRFQAVSVGPLGVRQACLSPVTAGIF